RARDVRALAPGRALVARDGVPDLGAGVRVRRVGPDGVDRAVGREGDVGVERLAGRVGDVLRLPRLSAVARVRGEDVRALHAGGRVDPDDLLLAVGTARDLRVERDPGRPRDVDARLPRLAA